MIDASKLPTVPNEEIQADTEKVAAEYVRAPETTAPQHSGVRPPAVQRNTR